ncbi:hypothetical protein A0J61_10596, partial [Choanephora cucurbitarum]
MTEIVYPAVYERVKQVTEKQKRVFDENHRKVEFPVGSTVIILTQANTYVLKNERGILEPRNYPPSLLKRVSDKIMEHKDDIFEVEAIVGHMLNDKNQYLYRCRWQGYDEFHYTWEPAENLTDPKFIKEYWQRIGEIPESITERNKANKRLLKDFQS